MKTIRIATNEGTFNDLFHCLYNHLTGCVWITNDDSFDIPAQWQENGQYDTLSERFTSGTGKTFEESYIELIEQNNNEHMTRYGLFFNRDLFPMYADIVSEDWNDLFAFKMLDNPLSWVKQKSKQHIEKTVYCHFQNLDYAVWLCSSADTQLLALLETDLKRRNIPYTVTEYSTT